MEELRNKSDSKVEILCLFFLQGSMSRDELAQLLLCYIGTAADIIEFFDSFKDPKVNTDKLLCLAVLCIWNWSLMQFTIIVPAAQNKAMNLNASACEKAKEICCNLDVWGILVTVILQVNNIIIL